MKLGPTHGLSNKFYSPQIVNDNTKKKRTFMQSLFQQEVKNNKIPVSLWSVESSAPKKTENLSFNDKQGNKDGKWFATTKDVDTDKWHIPISKIDHTTVGGPWEANEDKRAFVEFTLQRKGGLPTLGTRTYVEIAREDESSREKKGLGRKSLTKPVEHEKALPVEKIRDEYLRAIKTYKAIADVNLKDQDSKDPMGGMKDPIE
ncbi:MAG: hypothetical protein ABID54_13240 [Pseudomonadota bacterium]